MKEEGKVLYACILEYKREKVAYVVHAIRLSDLLSSCSCPSPEPRSWHSCTSTNSEFPGQVAYRADENLNAFVGCGVLGSKILFAGGLNCKTADPKECQRCDLESCKEIYVFDTTTVDDTDFNIKRERVADFLTGKSEPLLEVVGGKLYALPGTLSHLCVDQIFEVFDPAIGRWSILPKPPYLGESFVYCDHYLANYYSFVVLTNKILYSTPSLPFIYSFDCSNPQSQWEIHTNNFKGVPCPLPFAGKALTVVDDDDCLMFTYQTNSIVVYQMLNDDAMHIVQVLDLPDYQLPPVQPRPIQYSYVYLGDRKVCLFMATYMNPAYFDWMPQTQTIGFMGFFVVTLEFSKRDIHSDLESKRDVLILSTRMFDSKPRPEDKDDAYTYKAKLLGCFLPRPASVDKDADPSFDCMDGASTDIYAAPFYCLMNIYCPQM